MENFDAVIVGLGAAGGWAAKTLTENGLRVAALEAGPRLERSELPAELEHEGFWRRITAWRRQRIQARSVSYHSRVSHLYVDDVDNPYSSVGGDPFMWIRSRHVGGRMHLWARLALRLSDDVFVRPTEFNGVARWPITYEVVEKYYDCVERFHGLSGSLDGIPGVPDGQISHRSELTAGVALFRDQLQDRWPHVKVIAPRILGQEIDPIHGPLRTALKSNLCKVYSRSPVTKVILDNTGSRAIGVEYVDLERGKMSTLRSALVVLCASSFESVRLLFNSYTPHHPRGLGNNRDVLGRYAMDHCFGVGSGHPGVNYSNVLAEPKRKAWTPLDLSGDLHFYIPGFCPAQGGTQGAREFGVQGTLEAHRWGMGIFGEMRPRRSNRVTLGHKRDSLGLPVVNIGIRRDEVDWKMGLEQLETLYEITRAADLPFRYPLPSLIRRPVWRVFGPRVGLMHLGLAIHETGGARMGEDPKNSVLDQENRVWGVQNLYVTDGSCFPSNGYQNPTLTIMALTARACEAASRR